METKKATVEGKTRGEIRFSQVASSAKGQFDPISVGVSRGCADHGVAANPFKRSHALTCEVLSGRGLALERHLLEYTPTTETEDRATRDDGVRRRLDQSDASSVPFLRLKGMTETTAPSGAPRTNS
jgi:hypothetical protein